MKDNGDSEGKSYGELIHELKMMRERIIHHKKLTQEMHRLDAEWWQIQRLERAGKLPIIELVNADTGNTGGR
jgi:hypothetical protein